MQNVPKGARKQGVAWRGTKPLNFFDRGLSGFGCSQPEDLDGQGSKMRGAVDHTCQARLSLGSQRRLGSWNADRPDGPNGISRELLNLDSCQYLSFDSLELKETTAARARAACLYRPLEGRGAGTWSTRFAAVHTRSAPNGKLGRKIACSGIDRTFCDADADAVNLGQCGGWLRRVCSLWIRDIKTAWRPAMTLRNGPC